MTGKWRENLENKDKRFIIVRIYIYYLVSVQRREQEQNNTEKSIHGQPVRSKNAPRKTNKRKQSKKSMPNYQRRRSKFSTFWNIRKRCINHNRNDTYDTQDEEGKTIVNPEEAKEHIADYFEDLYQARKDEDSHKEWTKHINKQVDIIEHERGQQQTQQAFTDDELNQCIRKLKR